MADARRKDGPAVENRWWVDTGKTQERSRPARGTERPPVGSKFFDIGYEFDQDQARTRLTDINLKLLEEAHPPADGWSLLRMVPNESVPEAQLERMKQRLALPRGSRGVVVDSGRAVRFILTGDPVGERVLEFRLGEESTFDCWVGGEWVCEEIFSSVDDALAKARRLIALYLESDRERW